MRRPIVAIALCAFALGAPTPSARVTEVRVGAHPTFTRVVFELDGRAGYQMQTRESAAGRELVVTLQAASAPQRIAGHGPLISRVDVEPSDTHAIAHVRLRGEPASVKEMLLANPPRIVLDLMLPAPVAAAAAKPAAAKPAPAQAPPAPEKPVAKAEPAPEKPPAAPAPVKPIAKATPAPEMPAPEKPAPPAPVKPVAKAEPAPEQSAPPTPAPIAKATPPPVLPTPAPIAEATPPPVTAAPGEPAPHAEAPAPAPRPAAPAPAAPKPGARPPVVAKPGAGTLETLRRDPILLTAIGGAGLVVLLIAIVMLVRRRSRRTALDALESQRPSAEESSDLGPFGLGELPGAATDEERERERPASAPMSGPGLFDDDEPEKERDMEMGAQVSSGSSGLGTARAGADSEVARLVRELERRVAQLESRLDETNAARERLEKQVTAQSEELRVQRAAIARTQRALRGISRGGEEQATEPALRDPSTPSRT